MEALFCSDSDLPEIDGNLKDVVATAERRSENPRRFREQHARWLTNVRDACETTACLRRAYESRFSAVLDGIEICRAPASSSEAIACSCNNEEELEKAIVATMNEWRPYFEKTSFYLRGEGSADWQWELATKDRYEIVTRTCTDLECKRGRVARAIEDWRFRLEQ